MGRYTNKSDYTIIPLTSSYDSV